jgi:hypothetical protein
MNRDCHGDAFTINGRPLYRCLRDSAIVPGPAIDGVPCQSCGRDIYAVDLGEPPQRERTLREFFHPDYGWLVYDERRG